MINVESLIKQEPYSMKADEKDRLLLEMIKQQLNSAMKNEHIKKMFDELDVKIENIKSLEDIPYIPVQMFKHFDLAICPKEEIVRVLKSSGTTEQLPSIIPLNKTTALNQTKALASILSDYLGSKRRIFLVIDHPGMNKDMHDITARSAGIRGLSIYAKKIYYLLKEVNGELEPDMNAINEVIANHSGEEAYAFGFTFIIWTQLYQKLKEKGIDLKFNFNDFRLFHSGGWKKLKDQAVSKEIFSEEIAKLFNAKKQNVYDFYGMAEQTGIIFVDCEYGNKHVPNFAKVIIRDIMSQKPVEKGKSGIIEVMSTLSDSYYSQAILTEDIGTFMGIDDCPCGRKGEYFRFEKRIEKAEIRGCGDTFKEKKQ